MDSLNTSTRAALHTGTQAFFGHAQRAQESIQSWTTTRCRRLLRPLKAQISALRREMELENNESRSGDASRDIVSKPARATVQQTYSRRGRKAHAQPDKDRRHESTESSNSMRIPRKKVVQPGEIVLPTPVIRRARGQQFSSPVQQPALKDSGATSNSWKQSRFMSAGRQRQTPSVISSLESEMQSFRSRVSPTKFSLYASILRTLEALLTATAETSPGSRVSMSLMAMCLRKVPEYIGELEYWEEREAETQGTKSTLQNSEVSNQIYEEIETILPSNSSCGYLRMVVRAHGVKVIRDAMAECLLDDRFSALLVKLCYKTKSYLEGEQLLEVLVDCSYPLPKGPESTFDESRTFAPLKMLRDFAHESRRPQFMLRQISKLVIQQKLPPKWLSTREFASIWSCMVQSISANEVGGDAVSFAIHMITTLSLRDQPGLKLEGVKKNLPQQTLLSAITAVATLPILGQEARDLSVRFTNQNRISAISARAGYIIQTCIHEMKKTRKPSWPLDILKLAAFFMNAPQGKTKQACVSEVWDHIGNGQGKYGKRHYEAIRALICSIAKRCSQGTSNPAHKYLVRLCDQLDHSLHPAEGGSSNKMRVDCAFFLAEETNDLRDLSFAESLDTTRCQHHNIESTLKRESGPFHLFGFNWNEDICEWVTVSPDKQQEQQQQQRPRRYSPGLAEPLGLDLDLQDSVTNRVGRHRLVCGIFDGEGKESTKRPGLKHGQKQAGMTTHVTGRSHFEECGSRRLSADSALGDTRSRKRSRPADGETLDVGRGQGGDEEDGVVLCDGPKKRRTRVLKPRQFTCMKSIANSASEDFSEDELGL